MRGENAGRRGGEGGGRRRQRGLTARRFSALFFGRRCTALENKHRKDRNCFSERFDSRQMNLLKYTRNSTSVQYLHGRADRIYIRGLHPRLLNPQPISPKETTLAVFWGHVDATFFFLSSFVVAERLLDREKNHARSRVAGETPSRRLEIRLARLSTGRGEKRTCENVKLHLKK